MVGTHLAPALWASRPLISARTRPHELFQISGTRCSRFTLARRDQLGVVQRILGVVEGTTLVEVHRPLLRRDSVADRQELTRLAAPDRPVPILMATGS